MTNTIEDFKEFSINSLRLCDSDVNISFESCGVVQCIPSITGIQLERLNRDVYFGDLLGVANDELKNMCFRLGYGTNTLITEVLTSKTYIMPKCSVMFSADAEINTKNYCNVTVYSFLELQTIDEYNMTKALM